MLIEVIDALKIQVAYVSTYILCSIVARISRLELSRIYLFLIKYLWSFLEFSLEI